MSYWTSLEPNTEPLTWGDIERAHAEMLRRERAHDAEFIRRHKESTMTDIPDPDVEMAQLAKRRVLMQHSGTDDGIEIFSAGPNINGGEPEMAMLDWYAWAQMGYPEEITVSFEPGNTLDTEAFPGEMTG